MDALLATGLEVLAPTLTILGFIRANWKDREKKDGDLQERLKNLEIRLARQDVGLELLIRANEDAFRRRTGSDPPPREKLATISNEHE